MGGNKMIIMRETKMRTKVLLTAAVVLLFTVLLFNHSISAAESEEGHEHANHMGLFLGNTHHSGEDGFSVGVDYEHRISEIFGVGGLIEYAGGDFDTWIFGAPLYIHPYKGLRFLVAPGFETEENETKFLVRAGIAYHIPLGNGWSIAPEYNFDFVEGGEEYQVYGISVGLGF
jgi:hypothetical protein